MSGRDFWFGVTTGFGLGVTLSGLFYVFTRRKDECKDQMFPTRVSGRTSSRRLSGNRKTWEDKSIVTELEERFFDGIDKKAQLNRANLQKLKDFIHSAADFPVPGVQDAKRLKDILHLLRMSDIIQRGKYKIILTIIDRAELDIDRTSLNYHIARFEDAFNALEWTMIPVFELDEFELDVLILHTDPGRTNAFHFKQHLIDYGGISGLSVQTFEEFHISESWFQALGDIFKRTRYVFVYMSPDIDRDEFQRFSVQTTLMDSLSAPRKRNRIIPIWTSKNKPDVPEMKVFQGIQFWKYNDELHKQSYLATLNKLLVNGRKNHLRA